jgi:hypothetical protein
MFDCDMSGHSCATDCRRPARLREFCEASALTRHRGWGISAEARLIGPQLNKCRSYVRRATFADNPSRQPNHTLAAGGLDVLNTVRARPDNDGADVRPAGLPCSGVRIAYEEQIPRLSHIATPSDPELIYYPPAESPQSNLDRSYAPQ